MGAHIGCRRCALIFKRQKNLSQKRSGTVLTTLHTYSNLDHNTGYAQRSFDLSSYAGQTITLKFTGHEDYEYQTSFVIDDTAVNVS